jgi:hypothetical protein
MAAVELIAAVAAEQQVVAFLALELVVAAIAAQLVGLGIGGEPVAVSKSNSLIKTMSCADRWMISATVMAVRCSACSHR